MLLLTSHKRFKCFIDPETKEERRLNNNNRKKYSTQPTIPHIIWIDCNAYSTENPLSFMLVQQQNGRFYLATADANFDKDACSVNVKALVERDGKILTS